jgi:two-component system sensor histidine kinase/response regulator
MTGENASESRKDLVPLGIVIAVGAALAILTFMATRAYYASLDQQQFRRSATYYETRFRDDVARHVTSLATIRAFVSATRGVTRWEFSTYAHQILPLNAGFRALLWVPRLAASGRAAYEAGLQSDGLYGLRIHELTSQGLVVPSPDRASYFPISYVEPFDGNDGLVGLDLAAMPEMTEALHLAEQSGRVAASQPLQHALVAGTQGPTMLLAFPLITAPAADAAGTPQGFALGVLQLQSLVDEALGPVSGPLQVALAYQTGLGAPKILSSNLAATAWLAGGRMHHGISIDIAGRHFQLLLRSTSQQDPATAFYVPAGAALLVLALTILLAQAMFATVLRKRLVERAVVARTAQLRAANESLHDEIAHRRQAEQDLRVARDRAEAASRAKSSFLSIMSHELRTPLNAIIGFSGLLTRPGEHREEYAREILGSGQRLLGIINDILDLTEMASHAGAPDQGLVYLNDCIAAVVAEGQPAARAAGITLKAAVPNDLPPLSGDNKRISRALSHLVSNAIKFASEGGAAVVTARQNPDRSLTLEVMDNGVGMTPEARAKLCESFSQSDNRLGRRHEGLGLGLTYVNKVAEYHSARFDLFSEIGKGTRARLIFAPGEVLQAREVA